MFLKDSDEFSEEDDEMRRKIMMNKQDYVPKPLKEEPLYRLHSVDEPGISPLYRVHINGEEQKVYGNEFFHFTLPVMDENEQSLTVEVTVLDDFDSFRLRPGTGKFSCERDGQLLKLTIPDGDRVILELDDDLL